MNELEEWKLIIKKVSNGYILEGTDADGNQCITVIEENEKDKLQAYENLVWSVLENFGYYGSKHDKERLTMVREKQE